MNNQINSRFACREETNTFCQGNRAWRICEANCTAKNNTWRNRGDNCTARNNVWRTCEDTCAPRNNVWRNRGENCSCLESRNSNCACDSSVNGRSENQANVSCQLNTTWKCPNSLCSETQKEYACNRSDCAEENQSFSCLAGRSQAMVYSPYQTFHRLYEPKQGLCNGTVFSELNKPFLSYRRGS